MALEEFKSSQPLTMGVELELQLVSLSDFDLTASSPDLLHLLSRKPFPGNVTPEITESMIEINSDVHTNHGELLSQLQLIRDTLVQAGEQLNIGICGGGTHPFQKWSDRRIFAKPRFKEVSELYGYLAKQFTIFGQHVHIGCASGDDALFLLHSLSRYVPHFIALSSSSPCTWCSGWCCGCCSPPLGGSPPTCRSRWPGSSCWPCPSPGGGGRWPPSP